MMQTYSRMLSRDFRVLPGVWVQRMSIQDFSNQDWNCLPEEYLTPLERTIYDTFPNRGPRQKEWLLGRICAKEALHRWAKEQGDYTIHPQETAVLADAWGAPKLKTSKLFALALPHVSITHSQGHVMAALAPSPVGLDLERLDRHRGSDWFHLAFEPAELAVLPNLDPRTTLVGAWCAKEAVSKRLGTGLLGNPSRWPIQRMSADSTEVLVHHGGVLYAVKLYWGNAEVIGVTL